MNTEETTKLLKDLAWSRDMLAKGKAWIEEKQKALEVIPEYQELLALKDEQKSYQERADKCYETLTTWAEEEYEKDAEKNKHPIKGIEIKAAPEIKIKDEKAAKIWAATNAPATLSLNMTKFKPICKNLELEFVEVDNDKVQAYVSSDLSDYLPK
jgi:hypothetical protein